jgi:AcrR family transcriptional regulator
MRVTLSLVAEQNGSQALNLREIARALQCAHQSIYRYYGSYEALLEAAAAYGVAKMRRELSDEMRSAGDIFDHFERILRYFLKNEGLFRFLWLERHAFIENRVLGAAGRPSEWLISIVPSILNVCRDNGDALMMRLDLAHTYMIGLLAKYFNHVEVLVSETALLETADKAFRMILSLEKEE